MSTEHEVEIPIQHTQMSAVPSESGAGSGRSTAKLSSELLEERTLLVYRPHAITFKECKADDGTVITIDEIVEPLNIGPVNNLRSSVDVSRLLTNGDLVCKINEQYVEPNSSLNDFQLLLQNEYEKSAYEPITMTILKTSQKRQGKLQQAATVRKALKWKSEQEARYLDPRHVLKRRLDSIWVQLAIFVLIIIDLTIFFVAEYGKNKDQQSPKTTLRIITFVILVIFVTEIALRIYAMTPLKFFKDPLEVLDFFVVLVSLVLNIVSYSTVAVFVQAARSFRAFRFVRVFRSCIRTTKAIRNAPRSIRQIVRLNKQGYHDDEFDLDLCYITEHVIAMSLPSTGFEMVYRNPITDVAKFMDQHHESHYMIFDLCLERAYDHSLFHDRVTHYKFQDHGVPTISNMHKLCKGVSEWLDRHKDNCVAVHCKGGKGRTGTMICAWLLYRYPDATADEAIDLFATMRTNQIKSDKYQGIETYSQRRYVEYFHKFLQNPQLLESPPYKCIQINTITVGPLFNQHKTQSKMNLNLNLEDNEEEMGLVQTKWMARVAQRDESTLATHKVYTFGAGIVDETANTITFERDVKNEDDMKLCGNICVMVVKQLSPEPIVFASFWIHTYFLEFDENDNKQEIIIPKLKCDKLHKDKKNEKAPNDMSVKIEFDTFQRDHIDI